MLSIRQANSEDLDLIIQWTMELHYHEDDGEIKTSKNFQKNLAKWLEQELSNANSLCLIADIDDRPVGFIAATSIISDNGFLEDPLKGLIHLLWIEVEFRHKNIAQSLVSEVEHCFKSIGINFVECNYTSNNEQAQSFWAAQEYQPKSITARKRLN